ncbi:hypothetical protein SAMN02745589_0662 [Bifidobacterium merycicum DSM 6492]|nr:hypothetical protein SAMN02745589_0662 [Bifidobacterium merycicum DSM 6492]
MKTMFQYSKNKISGIYWHYNQKKKTHTAQQDIHKYHIPLYESNLLYRKYDLHKPKTTT